MKTSNKEITDILKALVIISLAFGIASVESFSAANIVLLVLISAITAGTGFLLHELGHKIIAQRYGCWAEFRSFDNFFIITILLSFLGVVFAAPGAVFIHGNVTKSQNGKISVIGPIVNIALAILFIGIYFVGTPLFTLLGKQGALINSWLAIFNMIPVWNLDGAKVFIWNKLVYFTTIAAGILLFIVSIMV